MCRDVQEKAWYDVFWVPCNHAGKRLAQTPWHGVGLEVNGLFGDIYTVVELIEGGLS
jgi:hypothetical protein